MSFRLSQPKFINISSPPSIGPNIDIPGYYQQNGVPINNQFYPALSTSTTGKAISVWTQGNAVPNANTGSWNTIAWSPTLQLFAATSQQSGTWNKIATSPDGINWQGYKLGSKGYNGMVWCSDLSGIGMFITTSGASINGNDIAYSTNGNTWIDVSTPVGSFGAVAYSPELKRVVACYDPIGFVYSNDGINWTTVQNTVTGNRFFYSITWSPKLRLFAAISITASSAPIATSPDGINWTYRTAVNTSTSVHITNCGLAWSEELGIFCAISDKLLISSDGINWFYYPISVGISRNLSWSSQLRIFLGTGSSSVFYSYNGLNWFSTNTGATGLKASCWSPELGCFLVGGDTNFRTSALRGRPPTSFNVFDSSYNNINELGLWNFQSFGRGRPILKTSNFTIQPGENWIDVSNSTATDVTLPSASFWPGREIMIKTIQNQAVNSSSTNIFPLAGGALSSNILTNTAGKFATIVSDGTNWQIRQAN